MENLEMLKNKKIILSVDPILKEYENIMLEKAKKYFKEVEFILGSEPEINSYYYKKLRKLKKIKILGKFIEKIYDKKIKKYYNKLLEKYLDIDYVLVIGEIGYSQEFIKLVKKKNKKIKFLKFIWDKMEQDKIEEYKENYDVVYTFEKDDSIRYNLKWRPSFFLEHGNLEKNIDFYYLGRERDKERYRYVKKIFEYCIKNNLNYKILLYSQDKKKKEEFITHNKIKYSENIENIKKSRVTFEKNIVNQKGLSLRTLECLAYNTKLITTNKDVVHYDFYDKNNIMVVEKVEDIENIDIDFFKIPYKKLSDDIINRYSFEGFIEEIFKNEK